jgi:hypothetical protein
MTHAHDDPRDVLAGRMYMFDYFDKGNKGGLPSKHQLIIYFEQRNFMLLSEKHFLNEYTVKLVAL